MPTTEPLIVATIGIHGSASTWVFNMARELLIAAHGADHVMTHFTETLDGVPDTAARAGRHLVLKSHHGSDALDDWLRDQRAIVLLSVRDPRDAVVSMAQRFDEKLPNAAHWLARDCAHILRLAARGHMLLRYEDRFFDRRESADRLARALHLDLPAASIDAIFARYRTAAVRAFAATVPDLPADRLVDDGRVVFDRETQLHRTHIGDARSGKWRDLPGPVQAMLTQHFTPYLIPLGYQLWAA